MIRRSRTMHRRYLLHLTSGSHTGMRLHGKVLAGIQIYCIRSVIRVYSGSRQKLEGPLMIIPKYRVASHPSDRVYSVSNNLVHASAKQTRTIRRGDVHGRRLGDVHGPSSETTSRCGVCNAPTRLLWRNPCTNPNIFDKGPTNGSSRRYQHQ